jgi:hypothetical protein
LQSGLEPVSTVLRPYEITVESKILEKTNENGNIDEKIKK